MRYFEKLIEVEPYRSCVDGMWYFKLVYEYMDEKGKHCVIYPKVSIPFSQSRIPYVNQPFGMQNYFDCDDRLLVFEGTSALAALKGHSDAAYVFDILTESAEPKEMTLEEIEMKLGHKVKIVSKENKND